MKVEKEVIGIQKIVSYPKEIYALHYKGKPFSISNLSKEEQSEMGISYPAVGTISRKAYFTKRSAEQGLRYLPDEIKDKVQVVKYVPETVCLSDKEFNELMELPLFKGEK